MDYGELGQDYPLTHLEDSRNTKERILLTSILLFAKRGLDSVGMRDIAAACELHPSSLYNHFSSKEALNHAVFDHIQQLYYQYFERLDKAVQMAQSYGQVVQAMFAEVNSVVNIFTYYGFSLIQAAQFQDEYAAGIYLNTLLGFSIGRIDGYFRQCIQKGWARPFDTHTIAAALMHDILTVIQLRVQRDMGRQIPFDEKELLHALQRQLLSYEREGA